MTVLEKRMMNKFRETAKRVVPEGGQVWLYGSHARGESHSDSDWDLLILLNKDSITTEDEDVIAYPFVVEGWKNETAVSPQLYTFEEWDNRSFTPYYKNVEQDKVRIR